jgi:hypothetical protein
MRRIAAFSFRLPQSGGRVDFENRVEGAIKE